MQRRRKYSDYEVWLCPICEAEIDPWVNIMSAYTYKHHTPNGYMYFCSWTCMRKWEAKTGYQVKQILTGHSKKRDEIDKEAFG